MTKALQPFPPDLLRDGCSDCGKDPTESAEALSPQIKATNFLNNILAKRESIAAVHLDSLLLSWRDDLTECTISNLFFVSGRTLHDPGTGLRYFGRHHADHCHEPGP